MTSKYCDECGHEKKQHIDRKYECMVSKCECEGFVRGPRRVT